MTEIKFDKEYFDISDTVLCGQLFRYFEYKSGYKIITLDKCCYAETDDLITTVYCEQKDAEYFKNYFDLNRDYKKICSDAKNSGINILKESLKRGKGIRILNQDKAESLFWFIVSQNNNIPRIKGIIERLCDAFGEEREFSGEKYKTFPDIYKMATADPEIFKNMGLGYRAEYIRKLAVDMANGFDINAFSSLSTPELKKKLTGIYGVGPKVADCVSLFGFHRSDSFPVDTWIEKVYREDFNGDLTDRKKIAEWFVDLFKENSGYYQQYLFYHKRSLN